MTVDREASQVPTEVRTIQEPSPVVTSLGGALSVPQGRRSHPCLTFQRADEIDPAKPEWLWDGWLLRESFNLLVGRQGAGKTTWVAYLVAALTKGRALPGDEPRSPKRVAILSLEEPPERVMSRLSVADADLSRVLIVDGMTDVDRQRREFQRRWSLSGDGSVALEEHICSQAIDLAVIDGIGYAINGDGNDYTNMGRSLSELAAVAERTGATILGLTHPPKGSSDAVTVAIGSTAWTAVPRVVMLLAIDQADSTGERRLVAVSKTNYKQPPSGFEFRIAGDEELECGYVTGVKTSTITADDLAAGPPTIDEQGALAAAIEYLQNRLNGGDLEAKQVTREWQEMGGSGATLNRAKRRLGVTTSPRHGFGPGGGYVWALPAHANHESLMSMDISSLDEQEETAVDMDLLPEMRPVGLHSHQSSKADEHESATLPPRGTPAFVCAEIEALV
jgi:hypothetical protein